MPAPDPVLALADVEFHSDPAEVDAAVVVVDPADPVLAAESMALLAAVAAEKPVAPFHSAVRVYHALWASVAS